MDSSMLPNCARPRLAVTNVDGSLSLMAITSSGGLENIYTIELEDMVPAAITFCKVGAPYLSVFGQNGQV